MTARLVLGGAVLSCLALPAAAQQVPALGGNPAGVQTAAAASTLPSESSGTGQQRPQFVPAHMPPPLPTMGPDRPLSARDRHAVSLSTRWRLRACRPTMDGDGVLHFRQGECEPTIVCAPFKVCDIALEPGEQVMDKPDIGDRRWKTHPRFAPGPGGKSVVHIVVKPTDAGLDSNMLIQTNRRTISFRLVSRRREYMPYVQLDNPDAENDAAWRRAIAAGGLQAIAGGQAANVCDQQPVIPPQAYEVSGDEPGWRPVQVFTVTTPVGGKTCIEFPASLGSYSLPTLVALDEAANPRLVNVRLVGRRFIVDGILDRAELVSGVGSDRTTVTIRRRG